MARDRLDGTKRGNIIWEIYNSPGRLVLWLGYMFPGKGYSRTRGTARHARSPIMTFLYSTGIWAILIWVLFFEGKQVLIQLLNSQA